MQSTNLKDFGQKNAVYKNFPADSTDRLPPTLHLYVLQFQLLSILGRSLLFTHGLFYPKQSRGVVAVPILEPAYYALRIFLDWVGWAFDPLIL
jgi:hypothetical protein